MFDCLETCLWQERRRGRGRGRPSDTWGGRQGKILNGGLSRRRSENFGAYYLTKGKTEVLNEQIIGSKFCPPF